MFLSLVHLEFVLVSDFGFWPRPCFIIVNGHLGLIRESRLVRSSTVRMADHAEQMQLLDERSQLTIYGVLRGWHVAVADLFR